jgi:arabinose-5-phosphate isomerase
VNQKPQVSKDTDIREVIVEISEKMLGVAAVVENDEIVGIITDGDIRRMLKKHHDINGLKAEDIMTANPKAVEAEMMAVDALELMESKEISQLLVHQDGKYAGVIHLHDLIKEGII